MANDLKSAFSIKNVSRALKWINTNPEFRYKNFFRDLYSSYAINLDGNLLDLISRLKKDTFEPTKPSRMYFPKPSGVLRPFTLLTIEDQIVYQALLNVVAEYHIKKAKKRYEKLVFGNLYAGKSSLFFYRKWDKGYKNLNKAIRRTHKDGYIYIASFDLTACYDSIDHKVIEHFLNLYGLEQEFIQRLSRFLSKWTSNGKIIHGHGIPQGPLGSGLLAEVVLSYLDEKYENDPLSNKVKYYRYVDDIKLLAKDEISLQQMLVKLDYYSKQLGLYPQSSKIEIYRVVNIEDEIKAISKPFDFESFPQELRFKAVEKKLSELINKNKITDLSTFKRVLSSAKPNSRLTLKLLKVLENNPSLFENIGFYLLSYKGTLSPKVVDYLLSLLDKPEVYQIVNARLLEVLYQKVSDKDRPKVISFVKKRWEDKDKQKIYYPYFKVVLLMWLLSENQLKYNEIKDIFVTEPNWWVLKSILKYVNKDYIGKPSYLELMKICLESNNVDVAISASHELIKDNLTINFSPATLNYVAQKSLRFSGLIKKASKAPSMIGKSLDLILNKKLDTFDWKKFFGKQHNEAENKIIRAQAYVQNDMTAFVNIFDVFNDFSLNALYEHDPSLGHYQLGNIGGIVSNKNTKLENKYPKFFNLCKQVHEKRLESDLSHPVVKRTALYTKPVEYRFIYKLRPLIDEAYGELINKLQNSTKTGPVSMPAK